VNVRTVDAVSGIRTLELKDSGNSLPYLIIFRPLASNALGFSQKMSVCNTFPEMGFEGEALRKALTLTLNIAHSPLRLFQVWNMIGQS